jgi:hypothetical protein
MRHSKDPHRTTNVTGEHNPMNLKALLVPAIFAVACGAQAQSLPASLSNNDLARHDFLYAGEAHDRNIYIVRGGKVVWSYSDTSGKGEISDAVMLSNGNILFAHQFGVTEITPEKKVIWNYEPPAGHEVHTAVPIGKDRVLYIENGGQAVARVVNIVTGVTEKEIKLPTKQAGAHGQFRHARLTPQGTLVVGHMDLNRFSEYDSEGNELWSFPGSGVWGVTPLVSGNLLLTDKVGVREVTRHGDTLWSWTPADTPEAKFASLQEAWRLPNGNTVINNWINNWDVPLEKMIGSVQAIELTPDKHVVWALSSWAAPANLGPATTIQFLDAPSVPEDVHFGEIK